MREPSQKVIEALAVTAEVCGAQLSQGAARVIGSELARYPEEWVLKALARCVRELSGRLTLAAILERLGDGRPSADEAWGQVGTDDETRTLVATAEAVEALAAARPLLGSDQVAARMAFKRRYEELVTAARAKGTAPEWIILLGWDQAGRLGPLRDAIEAGRITPERVAQRLDMQLEDLQRQLGPAAPIVQALLGSGSGT